jgi:hypothetical protein
MSNNLKMVRKSEIFQKNNVSLSKETINKFKSKQNV